MNYILKYYKKSKYIGFNKMYYKEFQSYEDAYHYVCDHNIRYCDYDIYAKVNL